MNSRFDIDKDFIIRNEFGFMDSEDILEVDKEDLISLINRTIEVLLSYDNIGRIILTYKYFSDRSCPGNLIKQTVEKLKADNL